MSPDEKDRLIEILFYLYFNNITEKQTGTTEFWNTIRSICILYGINDLSIIKAVRILMVSENSPQDHETYYLLNKMGLTVRPIRTISGIYWQKQKEFANKPAPIIVRRIVDPVIKKSIRDFLFALYSTLGILSYIDISLLEKSI